MTLERIAREATGRLVATLARASGDLALAEDAFAAALVAALEQWPRDGIPHDPEGWLYTVAKRKLVGQWRKAEVRRRKADALRQLEDVKATRDAWPDDRIGLLFVCAHPAIAPELRAPLMLQAVLGMTAEDVGPLMGVAPKTMGQRLWRAKRKIRDAKIPFVVPEGDELRPRLGAVLDAVYGLYGVGLHGTRTELADEAMWLGEVVAKLLDAPEAWGLAALLHYAGARRPAARHRDDFIPLDQQDPARWDAEAIERADAWLERAQAFGRIGPFQLEAAIQSALTHGHRRGAVDHDAVVLLYEGLVTLAPTLGIQVGAAAARAERDGPQAGLERLDALQAHDFQPWWAVRADLLRRLGRPEADQAYQRAIDLCDDPAVVTFLQRRRRLGEPR